MICRAVENKCVYLIFSFTWSYEDSIKTEAFKYISLPEPTFKPFQAQNMDSAQMSEMGFDQVYTSEPVKFQMRDGKHIAAQKFKSQSLEEAANPALAMGCPQHVCFMGNSTSQPDRSSSSSVLIPTCG